MDRSHKRNVMMVSDDAAAPAVEQQPSNYQHTQNSSIRINQQNLQNDQNNSTFSRDVTAPIQTALD